MRTAAPVLVIGATGTQGSAVARRLIKDGRSVRAAVRRADTAVAQALAREGAMLATVDFDDPGSLERAARDVSAMFAMATPFVEGGADAEARHGRNLVDAAVAAGVPHLVYSSVASANRGTGVPHFESKAAVERYLASSGLAWTVLAPVEFLENIHAPWALSALREGRIEDFVAADVARDFVAVDDLAVVAARVLGDPTGWARQRVEVASDRVTGRGLAELVAAAMGRPIEYVASPLPPGMDDDLSRMKRWISTVGYDVDLSSLRAALPGIDWMTAERWVATRPWSRLLAVTA